MGDLGKTWCLDYFRLLLVPANLEHLTMSIRKLHLSSVPLPPVDASWCLKNSSGLVARPNSCKRHFVHPNPLQTSLKHPYKPHMILGCTIFFFGDASHIILCCILYHPHLTNKKLTKSRCPACHARRQAWRQEKVQNLRFSAGRFW